MRRDIHYVYPAQCSEVWKFVRTVAQSDDEQEQLAILGHTLSLVAAGFRFDKAEVLANISDAIDNWAVSVQVARNEIETARQNFKSVFDTNPDAIELIDFKAWAKRPRP